MPPFLHQRLHRLDQVLRSADAALRAHVDGDPRLVEMAVAHLGDAGASYEQLGIADGRNQMLVLTTQVAAARDGINPLTWERVPGRRREVQRIVVLHALQTSSERLRIDYASTRQSLELLRERVAPLVLYALHKGLVSPPTGSDPAQDVLQDLWRALTDDPESQQAARQVDLSSTAADVLLVLSDLMASVR